MNQVDILFSLFSNKTMHIFHIFENLSVIFLFQLIHRGEHTFSVDVVVIPNCCAVYNCKNGYKSQPYDGNFHYFPSDEVKRQAWIDALPNADFKWTKNKCICDIHWPANAVIARTKGKNVPAVPPSIFPGVPSPCARQTHRNAVSRNIESRSVSRSKGGEGTEKDPAGTRRSRHNY